MQYATYSIHILKATNENIAMVTLHVENITWLGKPYSICVREPDYGFTYTKQNCMLECEGKENAQSTYFENSNGIQ